MSNNYSLIAHIYLEAYRHAQHDDALLHTIENIMHEPLDGLKPIEAMVFCATNDAEYSLYCSRAL